MQTAEVVIVGGGVIGASVAWHLAQRGVRDVLVIDRVPEPGGGSTPRATGGFRTQFSTEVNIRLSLLSREKLLRFEEEVGVDSGYRQYGYLFVARSEHALAQLREANALQHACGVPEARIISADEARSINPAIADDAILGGTYCPTDGFIRAMQILGGYLRAPVRFAWGVACNRLRIEGDRVVAVQTGDGDISARFVVNAAGAWAGTISDVPVQPLRRQVAITQPTELLPESMPMTIWIDDGFHLRVRDGRVLLLRPDATPYGFDATLDPAWVDGVVRIAHERVPILREAVIDPERCWAGLYEMSPDRHAILGRTLENLYLANGSSGHGVMHAPAIGQLVAEMIVDGRTSIDVSALRPSRFAEGKAIVASELL